MHVIAYFAYLVVGLFFYVLLSAVAAGGSGLTWAAAVPILAALVLGGFAPGLSLLRPRSGFLLALGMAAVLTIYTLILVAVDPSDVFALIATVPALVAAAISGIGLRRPRSPASTGRAATVIRVTLAIVPALPAAWLILEILGRLIG
jgi:hypothetical protein